MKKSRRIRLVLIGSLSAGAFNGCSPADQRPGAISTAGVYTNDHHVPGIGYYHAPYHAWYPMPYNSYDLARRKYFHGGQWTEQPHRSIINISAPTGSAVAVAQSARTDTRRSGFGSTGGRHSTWS